MPLLTLDTALQVCIEENCETSPTHLREYPSSSTSTSDVSGLIVNC